MNYKEPKLKYAFITILLVLMADGAIARSKCVSITEDLERLACYDIENGVEISEESVSSSGKWTKRTEVSLLTDDKNVFLSLDSEDDITARFGQRGPASIYLRCRENKTSAFFVFNGHFMSDNRSYGRIEYRIDDRSMSFINTSASTDNEALGLWNGAKSIPFIKRLIKGERLVIRATPHSESAVTATFDIRGLDESIVELRETCNW